MRLTLRTMLAYMDEVLEPADAEDLGRKIEESDFASGLMDRVRGVMKKLRMDAPKLDGKGMGNDANTVAEYLDSSLPQDRVGEFERVCLESDKHLCEVASCHQILTLVLGKPADVAPHLRERIYALGSPERATTATSPGAHPATAAVMPPPVVAAGAAEPAQPPLQVPEYLRSDRRPAMWPLVLVVAASLLFIALLASLFGRFGERNPLAALLRGPAPVTAEPNESTAPAIEQPTASSPKTAAVDSVPPSTTPAESPPPLPADTAASPAGAAAATTTPTPPTTTRTEAPSAPPTEQVAIAAPTTPVETPAGPVPAAPVPAAPVPATPAQATPAPATPGGTAPSDAAADTLIKPSTPIVATPPRLTPMEVGRYTSDGQLLATMNNADGLWYAKEPQAILVANERMVVLPPYRPQIALPSAVTLTFAGEGALRLNEPGENPTPSVTIEYGRFLAATAGRPGAEVELDLVGVKGVLTLLDADSVMAIKAVRWVPPGVDPAEFPGIPVIEMYNANGRASWQAGEQAKVEIPPRHVHVYYGADPPETHGPFLAPEWIDSRNIKPIDRMTADVLEPMIAPERPITLSLHEALKDRRVDVRALASRCLAALDDFEPALAQLADPTQHSFWPGQFEALRQAVSRSPETATKLREAITLLRPAQAKEIYRLLWGFSEEQVEKGAAADLVRFLDHDQMDVRVLAHQNLIAITGAWGFYRPERAPAQNKSAVQNWRDRLTKGAVLYRLPPSPLDTYKPVGAGAAETKTAPPPPMPR